MSAKRHAAYAGLLTLGIATGSVGAILLLFGGLAVAQGGVFLSCAMAARRGEASRCELAGMTTGRKSG